MRIRTLFPPHGRAYELFDSSVLLLVVAFLSLVRNPSSSARTVLVDIYQWVPIQMFGLLIVLGAAMGILGSYLGGRALDKAYIVVIASTLFVALVYFVGLFLTGYSDRVLTQVFIYGWIARRLIREEDVDRVQS